LFFFFWVFHSIKSKSEELRATTNHVNQSEKGSKEGYRHSYDQCPHSQKMAKREKLGCVCLCVQVHSFHKNSNNIIIVVYRFNIFNRQERGGSCSTTISTSKGITAELKIARLSSSSSSSSFHSNGGHERESERGSRAQRSKQNNNIIIFFFNRSFFFQNQRNFSAMHIFS